MGQQYHSTGATMDGSAVDNHNRAVFEEAVKVIKKAWTQETFNHDGEYYKVPYPYDTGITRWPITEFTNTYGAPGELGDETVRFATCASFRPLPEASPADDAALRRQRAHHLLVRQAGHHAVDPDCPPGEFPARCESLSGFGQCGGPQPQARRGPGRGALRTLRRQRAGGRGPTEQDQFCQFQGVLRTVRLLRGASLPRGRRAVPSGSVHPSAAEGMDRAAHARCQVCPDRHP